MATRSNAQTTEPPDTSRSGFSDEEKGELRDLIAEVVGGAKPPPVATNTPAATGPRQVSDQEWDAWSDRQREGWVRDVVDFRLDQLAQQDEQRRLAADVAQLKEQKSTPEPEAPPSIVTKIQRFIWGEPD